MGIFSRRPKTFVVRVAFRDLTTPAPDPTHYGYDYTWALPAIPAYGVRLFVPGDDGRAAPAVVLAVFTPSKGISLKPVARLATPDDMAAAYAEKRAAAEAWLRMAKKSAGLPGAGRVRAVPPEGFDPLPPSAGEATARQAGQYGRVWYRASKLGAELGFDPDAVKAFKSIALRWYAIRDRG